jgi:hypothetical protein
MGRIAERVRARTEDRIEWKEEAELWVEGTEWAGRDRVDVFRDGALCPTAVRPDLVAVLHAARRHLSAPAGTMPSLCAARALVDGTRLYTAAHARFARCTEFTHTIGRLLAWTALCARPGARAPHPRHRALIHSHSVAHPPLQPRATTMSRFCGFA